MTHLSRLLRRLARPLALVCVLMFAVGPIADSLICGFEPAAAEAAVLDPGHDDGSGGGSGDPAHAACAHGHCHHVSPMTGGGAMPFAPANPAAATPDPVAAPQPPSANQPNLERPPRA